MDDKNKPYIFPTDFNKRRPKTKKITHKSTHLRYLKNNTKSPQHDNAIYEKAFVLVIRGFRENLQLTTNKTIIVGRFSLGSDLQVDVDLTRYGAARYGVSRSHAQFSLDHQRRLYITDLNSTNGTLLNGKRLTSDEPYLIRGADTVAFGTLSAKVYLR